MKRISLKGKKKEGIHREFLQLRIPRRTKALLEERAHAKGMTLSEYVRALIHRDLEAVFGEIDFSR